MKRIRYLTACLAVFFPSAARKYALLASMLCLGCADPPLIEQEAFVFGTRVELKIYGERAAVAEAAAAEVLREFDRLHQAFHAWQPSELTRLNQAIARGEPAIEVSLELARLLQHAQILSAQSDDLFNPAQGRLIALWGFHSDIYAPRLPAPEAIAAERHHAPSMQDLRIEGTRITSRNRKVQLDLGGYAKGYALDRAGAILRAHRIQNALVNIGGNVMALGKKGGQAWRVGIAHPRGTGALGSVALHDGEAIGTSGDYQRYFEVEGRRYCHVLDPTKGYPATEAQAVTVLISSGEQAGARSDATSKPIFIAHTKAWRDIAERLQVEAVLRVEASGEIKVTPELARRIEWSPGITPGAAP
jgi:thiamine biosynthesis lipoprotein